MSNNFVCPNCGNKDPKYIGFNLDNMPYCRACSSFIGSEAKKDYVVNKKIILELNYPLSKKQSEISNKVLENFKNNKNTLIHAVTGAGKTELVYKTIEYALNRGLNVGFTVPRKDVVIDLFPRIQEAFPKANIASVYGGHTSKLNGDIILLTTHQLYRYKNFFDLLIFDEIDAFPYKGNDTLKYMFNTSVRGNYVMLSATPNKSDLDEIRKQDGEIITLLERYHHKKIPVPKFVKVNKITSYIKVLELLNTFIKQNKQVFIFCPTIDEGKRLFKFLSVFVQYGACVSSKESQRSLEIDKFKNGLLNYLVTTSILERGVTVKNLQIIVFNSSSKIYDKNALIQIAGRAGRKIGYEKGEVYFLAEQENDQIHESISEINEYNRKSALL